MTDHTVQGYLEGLSSEELEAFMRNCMQMCRWSSYAYVIPQILEILKEREYTVSTSLLAAWETYQQKENAAKNDVQ